MAQPKRSRRVGITNRGVGSEGTAAGRPARARRKLTAYDFRDELQGMLGWSDDELGELPVVYGSKVKSGEVYLDLDHPERGEFRASAEATINAGCRYVPKKGVAEATWYRLAASLGRGEIPHGNAAPTPGAFGQPNVSEISSDRFSGTFLAESGKAREVGERQS